MQHQHDHTAHHKMMIADFRRRFNVSLLFTIPILVLSPFFQDLFHYQIEFPASRFVLLGLAAFIFFYGGWPFLTGLIREAKKRSPGMMTLIAVATSVAFIYSVAVTLGLEGKSFFWELATLIDIMLLGHWLEMRSIIGASRALEELKALLPDVAHLVTVDGLHDVPVQDLRNGQVILIRPGEKVPADGFVVEGESAVDESLLTGESAPVVKKLGAKVIGGSINTAGSLNIEVRGVGESSYLSKVVRLVQEAQMAKSKTQALADRAAKWLTIISLSVGLLTFLAWLIVAQDLALAVERTATVMVITCPHALGLAIPLVAAVSTSLAATHGLLIRNRTAFEQARLVSTVLFDKTGTLTRGHFSVHQINSYDNQYDRDMILSLAAAVEIKSEHLIAKAVIEAAQAQKLTWPDVEKFKAIKGQGVEAISSAGQIMVISPQNARQLKINLPDLTPTKGTNVLVLLDRKLVGSINLADTIRPESSAAIKDLKKSGLKVWMITGDNQAEAERVATELHLDGFFAEVLPEQKQTKVKELQAQGEFVAMVGDGVNDAPALTQADVGIAIGSGTDVAAETADIIFINNDPQDIMALIKFGRATYRKMRQNLFWATGYNIIAIPLATGAFAGFGLTISPALGAVFMSLSTIIVAINAKFLKLIKS